VRFWCASAEGACPDEPPIWCSPLDTNYPGLYPVKFYSVKRDKQRETKSSWLKKIQVRHSHVKYYFGSIPFYLTGIKLEEGRPGLNRVSRQTAAMGSSMDRGLTADKR